MDDEFKLPILVIGLTAALFVIAACVLAHNYRAYTLKCAQSGGVMVRDQCFDKRTVIGGQHE